MRKPFLLMLIAVACASRPQDPTRPKIDIAELTGPSNMGYAVGPFDVQYELLIANPSDQPITLKRLELVSTGGGGAYSLRRDMPYIFNVTVGPGTATSVQFWAHAIANYYPGTSGTNSPVSLRGIAIFNSPKGSFQQVFMKVLSQFPE